MFTSFNILIALTFNNLSTGNEQHMILLKIVLIRTMMGSRVFICNFVEKYGSVKISFVTLLISILNVFCIFWGSDVLLHTYIEQFIFLYIFSKLSTIEHLIL